MAGEQAGTDQVDEGTRLGAEHLALAHHHAVAALRKVCAQVAYTQPLAVGLGIYLPTVATLMVVVGALVGAWYDKRAERSAKPETTKQLGVLLASGMIVGEGLVGVLIAGIVAFNLFPLELVGNDFASKATWIGGIAFIVAIFLLYRWVEGQARRASA